MEDNTVLWRYFWEQFISVVTFLKAIVFYPLYIMCLFPLTMILHRCSRGYKLGSKNAIVNYLLYQHDLKLYGRNRQEIESLVNSVRIFSDDICMEFGFDKCTSLSIHRGKIH